MKIYQRIVTQRGQIDEHGRMGYVPHEQTIMTDDIEQYNKRKRRRFRLMADSNEDPEKFELCRQWILAHSQHTVVYPNRIYDWELRWNGEGYVPET